MTFNHRSALFQSKSIITELGWSNTIRIITLRPGPYSILKFVFDIFYGGQSYEHSIVAISKERFEYSRFSYVPMLQMMPEIERGLNPPVLQIRLSAFKLVIHNSKCRLQFTNYQLLELVLIR